MKPSCIHVKLLLISIVLNVLCVRTLGQSPAWEKLHKESEGGWAEDLAVVNGVVWMTYFNELYASYDEGASWTKVLTKGPLSIGYGSANSTFGTDKKLIVSGDSIFFGNQFSPDGGISWQSWSVNASTLPTYYYSPTVLNIRGKNLYLGTLYNGFYQSSDFGKTFSAKNNGLPNQYGYFECPRAIEFYNGTPVISTSSGIHQWIGNTWKHCSGNGLPTTVVNGSTVYLIDRIRFLGSMWLVSTNYGVYFSNDLGTNWQKFSAIPQITGLSPWDMYQTPPVFYNLDVFGGKILVCFNNNIYVSTDNGATWTLSQLPDKVEARRIVTSNNNLLAATTGGIYKSTDDGASWYKSNSGFERMVFASIKGDNGEGYIGAWGAGVYQSSMRGKKLTLCNSGLALYQPTIRGVSEDQVFCTTFQNLSYAGLTSKTEFQNYVKTNNASQWDSLNNFPLQQIRDVQVSAGGAWAFAGVNNNVVKGIFLSEDKGKTWKDIFQGVTHTTIQEDVVMSMLFDGDTLYAGTGFAGIYKSWDKGITWNACSTGLNLPANKATLWQDTTYAWYIYDIRKFQNNLYAIAENGNGFRMLYHSSNGGKNWNKRDFSSVDDTFAQALVAGIALTDDGALIANVAKSIYSTNSTLFISRDNGNTWSEYGSTFPDGLIVSFDVIGDYIYVAGRSGLWRIEAPDDPSRVNLFAGNAHAAQGETVTIPVSVTNFRQILGAQFSVAWDTSVVTLDNITDFTLSGLDETNFNMDKKDHGYITFSWSEPSLHPQTLADSSYLFILTFSLHGNFGDTTSVAIASEPLQIEVIDTSYNVIPVRTAAGVIAIDTAIVVSGHVNYSNGEPLANLTVTITGGETVDQLATDADGKFRIELKGGVNYTITPSMKNDPDPLNGIDVQDVALLRRHVLGIEPLVNVYDLISSDVNRNEQVSTQDILLIQALILGERKSFPANSQWVFTPSNSIFQNANSPFPFNEVKNINGNRSVDASFTGMKLGDVNGSRDNGTSGKINATDVTFECGYPITNKDLIEVPVRVYGFRNVSAYQFSLSWDVNAFQLNEIVPGELMNSFGTSQADKGTLQVIWDNEHGGSTSVDDGHELFRLRFTGKNDGGNHVSVDAGGFAKPIVLGGALEKLNFIAAAEHSPSKGLSLFPNPFKNGELLSISFLTQIAERVDIEILSSTGSLVKAIRTFAENDITTVKWDGRDHVGSEVPAGLYIVSINYVSGITRHKVVKQ